MGGLHLIKALIDCRKNGGNEPLSGARERESGRPPSSILQICPKVT
jgi:hypothetical protein